MSGDRTVWGLESGVPIRAEQADRWILDLRGLRVARITVDSQLTVTLASGEELEAAASWAVVLAVPFQLSQGSVHTNPGVWLTPETQDVAAALMLFGTAVLSAVAFKSGSLRMVFDSGAHLNAPAARILKITGPMR